MFSYVQPTRSMHRLGRNNLNPTSFTRFGQRPQIRASRRVMGSARSLQPLVWIDCEVCPSSQDCDRSKPRTANDKTSQSSR